MERNPSGRDVSHIGGNFCRDRQRRDFPVVFERPSRLRRLFSRLNRKLSYSKTDENVPAIDDGERREKAIKVMFDLFDPSKIH